MDDNNKKTSRLLKSDKILIAVVFGLITIGVVAYFIQKNTGNQNVEQSNLETEIQEDGWITDHEGMAIYAKMTEYYARTGEVKHYGQYGFRTDGKILFYASWTSAWNGGYFSIYEYDERGDNIKETHYRDDESEDVYWLYEYGSNHELLREEYHTHPNGELYSYSIFKYANGTLIEKVDYKGDGSLEHRKVYDLNSSKGYNEYGQATKDWTETTWITTHKKVLKTSLDETEFEYDNDGNLKMSTTRSIKDDGTKVLEEVDTYDDSGNVKTEVYYKSDGSVSYSKSFEYDSDGREIKEVYEEPNRPEHNSYTIIEWGVLDEKNREILHDENVNKNIKETS